MEKNIFENMDYIYAVYREGSFTKAAAKLFISQPSLSLTVHRAEERIGAPVFDRSTSPIRLTEFGREYIRMAEKIYAAEAELKAFLQHKADLAAGQLVIGARNLCIMYILPQILERFRRICPEVELEVREVRTPEISERMAVGDLDLVITHEPQDSKRYNSRPLFDEYLLLALPRWFVQDREAAKEADAAQLVSARMTHADIAAGKNRLETAPIIDPSLLVLPPMVSMAHGYSTRERMDQWLAQYHKKASVVLDLTQSSLVYQSACSGLGGALISDVVVKNISDHDVLWFYKIENPLMYRRSYIYYRRDPWISQSLERFLKVACEPEHGLLTQSGPGFCAQDS